MAPISVVSLNVQGLNLPEKRSSLLRLLWSKRASIVFLQETRFRRDQIPRLGDRHFPLAYHSCATDSKTKGASILLSASAAWDYLDQRVDDSGRYVFIKGTLAGTLCTLGTAYLPNVGQPGFLERMFSEVEDFLEGMVIFGGDLNMALDPLLDSSSGFSSLSYPALRRAKKVLHSFQLMDTWRILHPSDRDFSFFSHPHNSYSRLDYLFLSHAHLPSLVSASIDPISFSDHALVSFSFDLSSLPLKSCRWRLNESLLQDPALVQQIRDDLQHYLTTNTTPETSPTMLWEAHKCFIRGSFIKLGSRLKKERSAHITSLLQKISELDSLHKRTLAVSLRDELCRLREQLRSLTLAAAKTSLVKCRRYFYEFGSKPGRALARALRLQRQRSFVSHIHPPSGPRLSLSSQIADAFRNYYTSLYNLRSAPSPHSPPSPDLQALDSYLSASGLPSLPPEAVEALESPLTHAELALAIKSSPSGKAPGPDGLSLPYYKVFLPLLSAPFLAAYNSLSEGSSLPPDALRASITVIPKDGKDPSQCASYRPISLLNVDLKLFAKILATRLIPFLSDVVHLDQVGFMPTREARDNTTRAINLLHHASSSSTPLMLLSTDAEKAFDRVDWSFLSRTLLHVGLGPSMRRWIESLYSLPSATVMVNGVSSAPFPITNGTRQGCPLSPLIFILTLEPLLRHIRASPDVSGVKVGAVEHKVAAYADDLLFFLTNPRVSLPNLMAILRDYQILSNYKINFQKSEALNVSLPSPLVSSLSSSFPFRWSSSSLKYLGILLTPSPSDLFRTNFPPLLNSFKTDLARWSTGAFSWFARCAIFKMNLLPRLLYLFQALPIRVPRCFFRQVTSLLLKFVWAGRPARLARSVMYRPKPMGGLALPNIFHYYVAVHLARVVDWHRHSSSKLWVPLESAFLSFPLSSAPWLPPAARPSLPHPTISPTLQLCDTFLAKGHLAPSPSPLFPILGNPSFSPGVSDQVFLLWRSAGVCRSSDFISDGHWLSQSSLQGLATPCPLGFWRTLQLSHFLSSLPPASSYSRAKTPYELLCCGSGPVRHSLSTIYNLLGSPPDPPPPPFISKWERDLNLSLSSDQQLSICQWVHSSSLSSRYQEAGYKILSRWYRVPTLLHKMFPTVSPLCWRGCGGQGTLLHIFWECPVLLSFWREVWRISSTFVDRTLPFSPGLFLLHLSDFPVRTYKRSVLRHLINAARACIPALWRSPDPPSIQMWIRRVEEIRTMEELTAHLHNTHRQFSRSWYYWLVYQDSPEYAALLRG